VNLRNWRIQDDDSGALTITSNVIVASGQYVVLSDGTDDVGFTAAFSFKNPRMKLAFVTDYIKLIEPSGAVHDEVAYTASWSITLGRSKALKSLTANNALSSQCCDELVNYNPENKGTPGKANVCGITQAPSHAPSNRPSAAPSDTPADLSSMR
jgi:hypothetical protein